MGINERSDSITGSIIGTSSFVSMPDGFCHPVGTKGFIDFIFDTPVSIQPGTTYYFQPFVQSGDSWIMVGDAFNYSGGGAYFQGNASPGINYWFREGIIVPEPSTAAIHFLGVGFLSFRHSRQRHSA